MIASETQLQHEVHEVVRLLMRRPITEALAMQIEAIEGFEHLEIEDGNWVGFDEDETIGSEQHGWIESLLVTQFTNWVLAHKTGRIYPGDTVFVLSGTPDDIKVKCRPDIAYVADANVKSSKGYIFGTPQIAIEVISPTERRNQMQKKLREYLKCGVLQVWQVFPDLREIIVHLPDGSSKTYGIDDAIDGGDLLPGFRLVVKSLFLS
jgi:Uma2 family endonuclease